MRRMLLSLVLALSLLLAGCGTGGESSGVLLYFCTDPNDHSQLHGPAIQSQPYLGPSGPGVEELVSALLAGPTQDGLVSPFPQGLSLQSWALEDGLLTLNFSEQYGGLADISLTTAGWRTSPSPWPTTAWCSPSARWRGWTQSRSSPPGTPTTPAATRP